MNATIRCPGHPHATVPHGPWPAVAAISVAACMTIPAVAPGGVSLMARPAHLRRRVPARALVAVAPRPDFVGRCAAATTSMACARSEERAINRARRVEGVRRLHMDLRAFVRLSPAAQVFVTTNLERVARGRAPVRALTNELDGVAAAGDRASTDPSLAGWTLDGGTPVAEWGSNWAGGLDALGATYFWVYDDGPGANVDCTTATAAGCWGHRQNVLLSAPEHACGAGVPAEMLMGAAVQPASYAGTVGIADILVAACGERHVGSVLTWGRAMALLHLRS